MTIDRRDRFDFRLLHLKDPFYDHIESLGVTRSDAIRHFIQQGISGHGGMSIDQQEIIKSELIALKREHGSIGTNLNQTARYFNQQGHLIESDLHQTHKALQQNQKAITQLINQLLAKL